MFASAISVKNYTIAAITVAGAMHFAIVHCYSYGLVMLDGSIRLTIHGSRSITVARQGAARRGDACVIARPALAR
jgi:hypothetical protein